MTFKWQHIPVIVLIFISCRGNEDSNLQKTQYGSLDSLQLTLTSSWITSINSQGNHENKFIAQFGFHIENLDSSFQIENISFDSITLYSADLSSQLGPFEKGEVWPNYPTLPSGWAYDVIVYKFKDESISTFECDSELLLRFKMVANENEARWITLNGIQLSCCVASTSILDSIDITFSKKIFSINAQPIVEPDPTVAVFYMTTHNPTGEIFEGLKIVQTDLYDTHDGYYGSILFDHNMSTQLAPFQTVTDTLYKGVSFKPLITLPFSIDFLKAIMVLKDQNNRIRFMTVDSVRIDRPA